MLEEDDVIVWVEERLDSISTLDGSVGNVLCEIRTLRNSQKIVNNSLLY